MWFVWFSLVFCSISKTLTFPQYVTVRAINQNEPLVQQKLCPCQQLDQPVVRYPAENLRRRDIQSLSNDGNVYPALMSVPTTSVDNYGDVIQVPRNEHSVITAIDTNTPLKMVAGIAPAAIMGIVSPQPQNLGSFSSEDQQLRYVRELVQSAVPYLQDKTQPRNRRKAKSFPAQLVPILTNVPIDQLTSETVNSLVRDARDIENYIAETPSVQQLETTIPMVSRNQPIPPQPLVHTFTEYPVKPKESELDATNNFPVRGDSLYYMQMQSFNFMNSNEDNSKTSKDVGQETINDSTDGKQSIEQFEKSSLEPVQLLQQILLQQITHMMKEQAADGDTWKDFDEKNVQEARTKIIKGIDLHSQRNPNEQIPECSTEPHSSNMPSSANTESNLEVFKTNS